MQSIFQYLQANNKNKCLRLDIQEIVEGLGNLFQ